MAPSAHRDERRVGGGEWREPGASGTSWAAVPRHRRAAGRSSARLRAARPELGTELSPPGAPCGVAAGTALRRGAGVVEARRGAAGTEARGGRVPSDAGKGSGSDGGGASTADGECSAAQREWETVSERVGLSVVGPCAEVG